MEAPSMFFARPSLLHQPHDRRRSFKDASHSRSKYHDLPNADSRRRLTSGDYVAADAFSTIYRNDLDEAISPVQAGQHIGSDHDDTNLAKIAMPATDPSNGTFFHRPHDAASFEGNNDLRGLAEEWQALLKASAMLGGGAYESLQMLGLPEDLFHAKLQHDRSTSIAVTWARKARRRRPASIVRGQKDKERGSSMRTKGAAHHLLPIKDGETAHSYAGRVVFQKQAFLTDSISSGFHLLRRSHLQSYSPNDP
jgi:hypothetical protein